jgi:hypothetical protein
MDEESRKNIDILDIQRTRTAREQIAASIIERELRFNKAMGAKSFPPIKLSVEVSVGVIEHQASPARVIKVCGE